MNTKRNKIYHLLHGSLVSAYEHESKLVDDFRPSFPDVMQRWEDKALPWFMNRYAVRFNDGGGFYNDYDGAKVKIDGYEFDLESIFYDLTGN